MYYFFFFFFTADAQVGLITLIMPAFIKAISIPGATPTQVSMCAVKQSVTLRLVCMDYSLFLFS